MHFWPGRVGADHHPLVLAVLVGVVVALHPIRSVAVGVQRLAVVAYGAALVWSSPTVDTPALAFLNSKGSRGGRYNPEQCFSSKTPCPYGSFATNF